MTDSAEIHSPRHLKEVNSLFVSLLCLKTQTGIQHDEGCIMTTFSTWAQLTWGLSLRLETLFMTCLHLMGDSDYISGATLPQILNPLQINEMKMAAHWQLHALLTATPSSILMKSIQSIIKPRRAARGAFACCLFYVKKKTGWVRCVLSCGGDKSLSWTCTPVAHSLHLTQLGRSAHISQSCHVHLEELNRQLLSTLEYLIHGSVSPEQLV